MLKKELVDDYIILTFGKTPLLTVWTVSFCLHSSALKDPANKYMFKVSNKITRKWSELCLKLTRKTSEWRRWRSDVFIVNFKHIFAHFSSVSTVEFEQVNVRCNKTTQRNVRVFFVHTIIRNILTKLYRDFPVYTGINSEPAVCRSSTKFKCFEKCREIRMKAPVLEPFCRPPVCNYSEKKP